LFPTFSAIDIIYVSQLVGGILVLQNTPCKDTFYHQISELLSACIVLIITALQACIVIIITAGGQVEAS
jgi:hypothetical protein